MPQEIAQKPQRLRSGAFALCFAASLPLLQRVAREHGYALSVHGSMATDLDLIAAPWTEEATDAEMLIEALRASINGFFRDHVPGLSNPAFKPHGRLAWSIYTQDGESPYLDISVMPRSLPCP